MRIVLIATYEMGRQPMGLASPAAWLREAGFEVACYDLGVASLPPNALDGAAVVGFHVPMHTATRLTADLLPDVRKRFPDAALCCYGLYAPVSESLLRERGADVVLGGEFEAGLLAFCRRVAAGGGAAPQSEPRISLERLDFRVPDRGDLPALDHYARFILPDGTGRRAGYVEASRGCKHTCRHCPVVPVYNGRFRIIPREIVLEDIARQVAAGAGHITFGDPDFFNGPGHAMPLVRALHERFPGLSFDVTIKVEHLLLHADLLPELRRCGCALVTSAVEALDERILTYFDKRHTRDDFIEAVRLLDAAGLPLNPTFVTFTPWTTLESYADLLETLGEQGLLETVSPIQLAIRLLIPSGSRLLELPEVQAVIGAYDDAQQTYVWRHRDPTVERFFATVRDIVMDGVSRQAPRKEIVAAVWGALGEAMGKDGSAPDLPPRRARAAIPYLNEPWYC